MPRVRRVARPAPASSPNATPSTVIISNDGDVLIQIKDSTTHTDHCYRCSRTLLCGASEFFNVLLDPVKFSEGIAIEARLQDLKRQYNSTGAIPASELPKAIVTDVGDLPKDCVSTGTVVALLFKILHDNSTAWPIPRSESANLVALLAIVADRFACPQVIANYLEGQRLVTALLKTRKSDTAYKDELENRQKLLAGWIFGFSHLVLQCSAFLIVEGPRRQTSASQDSNEDEAQEEEDALWWRLPSGIEEELACRRDYVLDTLSSIQKHFINLYISRKPQCRLGYDSSLQCDSYQLGEMIRFFSRTGTLQIESVFDPAPEELEPYNGNLDDIMFKYLGCSSYQIDSNHKHCGIRTRLMSILDGPRRPRPRSQAGICLECWKEDKSTESWLENPIKGTWTNEGEPFARCMGGLCRDHRLTKAMYTAVKREWTPVCGV